jgi:hypothetical protein
MDENKLYLSVSVVIFCIGFRECKKIYDAGFETMVVQHQGGAKLLYKNIVAFYDFEIQ